MFGLGAPEIIAIVVIVLLLFGPKKLPELAKSVGQGLREFKKSVDSVKGEITATMQGIDTTTPVSVQAPPSTPEEELEQLEDPQAYEMEPPEVAGEISGETIQTTAVKEEAE